jgi:transposase
VHVSPAEEQDREQVGELAGAPSKRPRGSRWSYQYVDEGYTAERTAAEAEAHGIRLEVVKHPESKRGFVLLLRRWVVERDFAWASRLRRLVKDYERLPETVAGLHFVAFVCLFLQRAISVIGPSP